MSPGELALYLELASKFYSRHDLINFYYCHIDAVNYSSQKHDLQKQASRGKMTSNFNLPPSSCPRRTMTLNTTFANNSNKTVNVLDSAKSYAQIDTYLPSGRRCQCQNHHHKRITVKIRHMYTSLLYYVEAWPKER